MLWGQLCWLFFKALVKYFWDILICRRYLRDNIQQANVASNANRKFANQLIQIPPAVDKTSLEVDPTSVLHALLWSCSGKSDESFWFAIMSTKKRLSIMSRLISLSSVFPKFNLFFSIYPSWESMRWHLKIFANKHRVFRLVTIV